MSNKKRESKCITEMQSKRSLFKFNKSTNNYNIPLMKLIKKSFDPNNILNPGKVFDV